MRGDWGVRALVALGALALVACGEDGDGAGAEDTGVPIDADAASGGETGAETGAETADDDVEVRDDAAVDDDAGPDASACPAGTPCGDGDPCVTCEPGGDCQGEPMDCDDGIDCTEDACEDGVCTHTVSSGFCLDEAADEPFCVEHNEVRPSNTCAFCDSSGGEPVWKLYASGSPCEDGDACTTGDHCDLGECVAGSQVSCSDDDPCVDSTCDPAEGCIDVPTDADCDDGDACTEGDTCADGACAPGEPIVCDDGDPCTVDSCDPEVGCVFTADTKCDDGHPCTSDECLDDGTCVNEPVSDGSPCEDGDLCTVGETCVEGVCTDGEPADCDDDNPCTEDACDPEVGCTNFFLDAEEAACDDGHWCTDDDKCVSGLCIGGKTQWCIDCLLPATDHALKVVEMEVSGDGNAGSGFDLDGDPETCAPAGQCSGGVDNALAVLAPAFNDAFTDTIEMGAVFYVIDLDEATFDGDEWPIAVYDSRMTQQSQTSSCDYQNEKCHYTATQFSFDPGCEAYFGLPNATIENGQLTAGGEGYTMTLALAISAEIFIPVTLLDARVRASVTTEGQGEDKKVVGLQGFMGGAAPKAQLMDAIEALPPHVLPLDKDFVLQLLEEIIENDLDLDGDGVKDAASVAIRMKAIPAVLEN